MHARQDEAVVGQQDAAIFFDNVTAVSVTIYEIGERSMFRKGTLRYVRYVLSLRESRKSRSLDWQVVFVFGRC